MALRRVRQQIAAAATVTSVRPAWAAGLRGAIATMIPIAVGGALGWPGASWMGLAGFCASTADKGGAYRTRAEAMAGVGVFGAIAAMLGSIAGGSPWLGVVLVVLIVTFCTVLRVFGQAAVNIGTNAIVMYIVGMSAPCAPREALDRCVAIVAGALWAMLIALALWPIRFYRPARVAIAGGFRSIASYANDVARLGREQLSRDQRRALFLGGYNAGLAAMETAREVLAAIRRGRQVETRRGERLLVLLEKADRAFARLTSLAEAVESEDAKVDVEALRRIASACQVIASIIENEQNAPVDRVTDEAAARALGAPAAILMLELERAIDDAADTALGVNSERPRGLFEAHRERPGVVATFATVLTWRSIVFRHALRVGIATGAAVWLTEAFHLQRGYWVTFSAFIILQPYTTATLRKGLQRIVGTLLGGVLAAVAVALVHSAMGITVLIFVGAFVCLALLPVNYGLYAVFMTPTFILLAELGERDWHLAGLRIVNTLIGCAIGFVAARVLWPSSERAAVRDEMVAVASSLAAFAREVIGDDLVGAIAARRAAQLELQNADAALQQALSDPHATGGTSEAAMAIIVHGRRFALALSALAVATRGRRRDVAAFLASIADALDHIAAALRDDGPVPPLPTIPAALPPDLQPEPLLRQLETIHDAAARFVG
jgi:uncharacterized membrane protein YccC